MKIGRIPRPWLLCAAVGWLGGGLGLQQASASFAYTYGQQTITNLIVSGAGLTNVTFGSSSTNSSAAQGGAGVSANNSTDALQSYVGTPPSAPQNDFTKFSTAGGGPQAGDFTRGDVVLGGVNNLFTTGASASTVAESFSSTPVLATGASNYIFSGTFSAPSTTLITVSYGYSNDIIAEVSGGAPSGGAQFGASISIKDQHGHEVDATPAELNTALSAPPNGPEIITSGSSSATLSLAGLTAGDLYSISISGESETDATGALSSTPEPASLAMAGLGVAGLLFARRRRQSR